MSNQQSQTWQKRKQLGRSKYLLQFGVLPWGIGLTILFGIIEFISFHEMIWNWIPVRLVVFSMVGFFIANGRWQSMERRFEASRQEQP
ncbi:hypothetical protein [Paenibacillus hexagrammi]|uniref:Uncharacterized protein n=1 Tax=Paenibacillus hexagrammi TaxID=2908839 RepID=A0ABY3SCY6_9BACL|nr:hypothetical protein [Paenibacillus sp. YPD9-1]UJF31667.1 hypothetical protein L0M14_17975 [Paenibacillus sp. YPD9-1]